MSKSFRKRKPLCFNPWIRKCATTITKILQWVSKETSLEALMLSLNVNVHAMPMPAVKDLHYHAEPNPMQSKRLP